MIEFTSLIPGFHLNRQQSLKNWLKHIISLENKLTGNLNFIFCTDEYLLEINKKYLQHDYYTDIITFPMSTSDEVISGDIYISIDRIRENAEKSKEKFEKELARVIVHGVLHLAGLDDKTQEQVSAMRSKEDKYLFLLPYF